MSFGISAAGWAAIAAGTVAATSAYSADQQRKAVHGQQDALRSAQAEEARASAKAEADAATATNSALADSKRRRRASSLLATGGAGTTPTLGGAASVLSSGAPRSGV